MCVAHVNEADDAPATVFETGKACDGCTVVLHGRLHVVCGSEEFESDRGPWTVLGAPSLRQPHYVADFTAKVMEPSRLLQISRVAYEQTLRQEAETLAAAVRAAACEAAHGHHLLGATARSPAAACSCSHFAARVACTLSSDLASAYNYSLYAERPPPAPEPSPGAPTPFGASPPFVSASSSLPSTFLDAPTPVSTPLGSGGLPRARATSPTQAYGSGASMGSGTFSGPRSPRNSKEVAEL